MPAIECATREFLNMLTTVRWEWLLLVIASRYFSSGVATIISTDKLLKSRLKSRSHNGAIGADPLLSIRIMVKNSQPGPRNSKPETLTPEP